MNLKTESHSAAPRTVPPSRLSTAQILSMFTAGIVLVVLIVGIAATWLVLTRSAIDAAQARLDGSVRQLASVAATAIRGANPRYLAIARDTALHRVLRRPSASADTAEAQAVIARLRLPSDSGMPIELLDLAGRRVTFVGNDLPVGPTLDVPGDTVSSPRHVRPGLSALSNIDSLRVGRLYITDGRSYFWIAMPVREGRRTLGYILQQRRIATNPQAERTIRELSGDSVAGYYHNADGTGWTSFGGAPAAAPNTTVVPRKRPGVGRVLFAEQAIEGTPLVVAMETSQRSVLARPGLTIRWLSVFAVVLTLLAAAFAWLVGRAVARPLQRISAAAEEVARGDYGTRVPTTGTHEIASLADRFNRMAVQIGDSRTALVRREDELRLTAEAAKSASQAKSDFLAAMSHELRTPLNAIGGYTELLELGVRGPITDEQRRDLERIRISQQHLLNLIGSVLDLSRIERGHVAYDLTAVDVAGLLAGLEPLVSPQAAAKRHTLHFESLEPGLTAVADAEKLRQILLNLVSNAIRHTPEGTRIMVSARSHAPHGVEIVVRDNGPGIPVERHQEVFEPFVQLDRSLINSAGGIGLGLAISRDLARGMGGDLEIMRSDVGACFAVRLKRAEDPAGRVTR